MNAPSGLLVGFSGHLNLGDDLMERCLDWCARRHWGLSRTRAESRYLYSYHSGARPLANRLRSWLDQTRLTLNAMRSQLIVFGGGSMFHSANSSLWKGELIQRVRRSPRKHSCMAIGVGLGPFPDSRARDACQETLSLMDLVLVRDLESLAEAQAMDLPCPTELCADPAYLLPEAFPGLFHERPASPKRIAWILRPDRESSNPIAEDTIIEAMRRVYQQTGLAHRLLVFNANPAFIDLAFARRVTEKGGDGLLDTPLIYNGDNMFEILAEVRDSAVVVSSRLHGMVTAAILGAPLVPLSYHPKCDAYARDAGLAEQACLDIETLEADELARRISTAALQPPTMPHTMDARLTVLKKRPAQVLSEAVS